MTSKELENRFAMRQMKEYCKTLKIKYDSVCFKYDVLSREKDQIIKNEVANQTKYLTNELKEKDKQIEALKVQLAKLQSKLDNDSTNSGLPTSKTPIGKKKYIPNTREKTNKNIGAQKGHKKHKLEPFNPEEATEVVEIIPKECNKCHSHNIEKLDTSIDKEELDYEVVLIKRNNKFVNCRCKDCGNEFHSTIPNDLKEDIQYGKTVQSLALCLTNEIYTPFNKTSKLISGVTNGEINMSEGYITKLQKKGAKILEPFISELEDYIKKSPIYGWDDGIISIGKKDGILRVYCTDKAVLLYGHEHKNEASLNEDGILMQTPKTTIVMHDHITHNYNDKYVFDNVECMIHLIRRLNKMHNNTQHSWNKDLIKLLSDTNTDRNKLLKDDKDKFGDDYLKKLDAAYDKIISKAKEQNNTSIIDNPFKSEEEKFIEDLIKYKRNYLLWAYNFSLPSTNNNSERSLRPVKSKLKISGHFQNINYAKYYATIRSYIETCKKNGVNIIEACVRLMNDNPYTLDELGLNINDEESD